MIDRRILRALVLSLASTIALSDEPEPTVPVFVDGQAQIVEGLAFDHGHPEVQLPVCRCEPDLLPLQLKGSGKLFLAKQRQGLQQHKENERLYGAHYGN